MESQTYKFTTGLDIMLYLQRKDKPSSRWLDWQEYDRGPGIFNISEDQVLGIRAQSIDDISIKQLVRESAEVKNLRYLYLAENRAISDKGILNLSGLPQLEYLNISACDITSAGLAFLPSLSRLLFLDLSYCNRVSNKASIYVQKLPQLKYLDIKGVIKINTSGIKKFERRGLEIRQY